MRRYIERADQIARVVEVNLDLAFDRAPLDVARLWGRLLSALWPAPAWAQVNRGEHGGALADLASVDAVASCVAAARENARQVREHISGEMWERVNGLHLTLNDPARRAAWKSVHTALRGRPRRRGAVRRGRRGRHDPRRRLALPSAGPVPGAGRRHGASIGCQLRTRSQLPIPLMR